jgi:hypothetical protein
MRKGKMNRSKRMEKVTIQHLKRQNLGQRWLNQNLKLKMILIRKDKREISGTLIRMRIQKSRSQKKSKVKLVNKKVNKLLRKIKVGVFGNRVLSEKLVTKITIKNPIVQLSH